jgi:maltose O-acetyltransferase
MTHSEKEKMLAGKPYNATAPEIQAEQLATATWLAKYNGLLTASASERLAVLRERLAKIGDGSDVRPPFYCDYGFNISIGSNVFLNFNCIILDVVDVSIGDKTRIGPAVQILTADHPRDPIQRAAGLEFGRPISIGRNVWIGGGAIILPGINIGDDAIVGAGAVVTRNVPAGARVIGNPAR